MAKPNIALLPAWASNPVFTTGPAIGLPTKIIIPAPVANEGHRPGAADPTGAEYWNDWLNQVYQWCVWVDEGTPNPLQTAHIVETDALGVASLYGLAIVNPDDVVALSTSTNTSLAPGAFFYSNTAGTAAQAEGSALTAGPAMFADNAGPGASLAANKANLAVGDALRVDHSGVSGRCALLVQDTGNVADEALEVLCLGKETAIVADTTGGAALRIPSQPFNPAGGLQGEISLVGNDLKCNRQGAGPEIVWITEFGVEYSFATDIGGGSSGSADNLVLSTLASFFNGKRYQISLRFHLRQNFGTPQRADVRIEVNGNPVAGLPGVPTSFPAALGTAMFPYQQVVNYTHAAASALLTLDAYLDTTPSGIGPTWVWEYAEFIVLAHFD